VSDRQTVVVAASYRPEAASRTMKDADVRRRRTARGLSRYDLGRGPVRERQNQPLFAARAFNLHIRTATGCVGRPTTNP
jgi:hypothetical protein